jgi:predicted extracellular nuclease
MRLTLLIFACTAAACSVGDAATPIHEIQGSGRSSPLENTEVTVEGVVTGDFQDGDADAQRNLGGFYLQGAADGDPETSDGIFVFDGSKPTTDVVVGNVVRVVGTVNEYYNETQISASSVSVVGDGSIEPLAVTLPLDGAIANSDGELIANLERYEGMLITFPQTLTVSQLRNLERYGEVLLSEGGREYSYTNLNAPDVLGYAAHIEAVTARRIHLDDGLRNNNPGLALPIRNGDEVTGLTGVLRYARGSGSSGTEAYRVMPTVEPDFDNVNPQPAVPSVDGSLRIAMFNVNNYFSTVDTGERICGPEGDDRCRGADSEEELSRQLSKIVTVVEMLDADIVAMIEIENNTSESLSTIVDGVNAAVGAYTFNFVDTGTIGDDAIKVGLLYKPARITPVGEFAILDSSVDVRFADNKHRPVLAQTFETVAGGKRLTVLNLHLKSKGSSCESIGDPDIGDGQGNCSATRSLAAAAIVDWIATDPTSSNDNDFLVIGDFNTHTMGDAMSLFEQAGYANLASHFIGEDAYSFEFDGQFGALDHAMASPTLAPQVVDTADWHINADEAPLHDYNLEYDRDPSLFDAASPYRASDHDPLIIGIEFPD